jgi:hypothetical protein
MEWPMSEKFDPAPIDKHAEPTKKDAHEGKTRAELEKRLEDSFPASDPVSSGIGPCQQHTTYKDNGGRRLAANEREDRMGLAVYEIFGQAGTWRVRHDGKAENVYETKEAAFEAAVVAASLALRQGHEVRVTAPASDTSTGAANAG